MEGVQSRSVLDQNLVQSDKLLSKSNRAPQAVSGIQSAIANEAAILELSDAAMPKPTVPDATLQQSEPTKEGDEKKGDGLSKEEQTQVEELKQRDREVRTHEQAHLSALGPHKKGGAQFQYTTGPDGKQYATSGEVPVDLSSEESPEQTIRKMQTVRRAATAPAEPSGADRAVAAQAAQKETQARKELAEAEPTAENIEPLSKTTEAEASETTRTSSVASSSEHQSVRSALKGNNNQRQPTGRTINIAA